MMYSPKIDEALIPVLYYTAKDRGVPMTRLVDSLLVDSLLREQLPPLARDAMTEYLVKNEPEETYSPTPAE